MSEPIRETAGEYEMARCPLPGCGHDLHMVITSDQPLYLSFTAGDLQNPDGGWDSHWEVRCEAGHVVLLPPDTAEDSYTFGCCRCDPGDPMGRADLCGHGDMARLRAIASEVMIGEPGTGAADSAEGNVAGSREIGGRTPCTAGRFGDHDYSQPPHNTPDNPREDLAVPNCQARSAAPPLACQGTRDYEFVIYQIATHDWIRIAACTPCTATLRIRHRSLGPGGSDGVARVRTWQPA